MKCPGIPRLLMVGLLAGCSGEPANPLAEGLSAAQQAQLKLRSFGEIEAIENFSPESFEALQRAHFETMIEDMRQRALENLPTRVEKITVEKGELLLHHQGIRTSNLWEADGAWPGARRTR